MWKIFLYFHMYLKEIKDMYYFPNVPMIKKKLKDRNLAL